MSVSNASDGLLDAEQKKEKFDNALRHVLESRYLI
jgi:hypothetical protein